MANLRKKAAKIVARIFITVFSALIALIPTWIYLIVRSLAAPKGFWQEIVIFGVGAWLLGGIQIVLIIILVIMLYRVWVD